MAGHLGPNEGNLGLIIILYHFVHKSYHLFSCMDMSTQSPRFLMQHNHHEPLLQTHLPKARIVRVTGHDSIPAGSIPQCPI